MQLTVNAPRMHIHDQFLRLALVTSLIPSVNFSLTNFDTQPFAAILGFICIGLALSRGFPLIIWTLAFPAIAAILIAVLSSETLVGLRSIVTYASPWIFACTAYLLCQRKIEISRYIVFMLYLWALVGLIQWLIDPRVFEFLVNARTTDDRGITSLSPEPSFYGLTIIQMWLTLLLIQPRTAFKIHVIFISIFQVLILTQSTLAILVLLSIIFILVFKSKIVALMWVFGVSGLYLIAISGVEFDRRVLSLVVTFINDPAQILYADGSISERFYHIFLSLKYSLYSGFMPHGFNAFAEIINAGRAQYSSFWWGEPGNKIFSGIGSVIFELGWFSFFYFFAFYIYIFKAKIIPRLNRLVAGAGMFLVLLNSVTMAAPLFGIMIGIMASINRAPCKFQEVFRVP